jgi:hypothetical protein
MILQTSRVSAVKAIGIRVKGIWSKHQDLIHLAEAVILLKHL